MKLSEIAKLIGGVIEGDDVEVGGVSNLEEQRPGEVVYVEDKRRLQELAQSDASALIIDKKLEYSGKPVIRVDNPKLAFAKLLEIFDPCGKYPAKVYDNAHVEPTAKLGKNVTVMPFAAVMEDAEIGDDTVIYSNVFVGRGAKIGRKCILKPGAVVMDYCVLGEGVILQPNCVVGSDGFGYVPVDGGQYKIPQIGKVVLSDGVEVGACTTIDRATITETDVGKGVKIDNLVQIAHNCKIGENSIIISQVGIAGSTKVGKNCIFAGQSGVTDHAEIGDNVVILARSGIDTKHVESGKVLFGSPARDVMAMKRIVIAMDKLPELIKTVREMTKEKKDEK